METLTIIQIVVLCAGVSGMFYYFIDYKDFL